MKYAVRLLTLVALLASSGCYRYAVDSTAASDGVERRQRGPTFLWGLVGQEKLAAHCDSGLARSESYMPWWGGIIGTLTVGLVIPWRVDYECVQPTPPAEIRIESGA